MALFFHSARLRRVSGGLRLQPNGTKFTSSLSRYICAPRADAALAVCGVRFQTHGLRILTLLHVAYIHASWPRVCAAAAACVFFCNGMITHVVAMMIMMKSLCA
jgi:hypothetical protein